MIRTTLSVLLLLPALLLGLTASPARAAGELGLSRDGVHWTSGSLTAPLFDPAVRWVPGDVRTERFYVRNQAFAQGLAGVTLSRGGRDALYASDQLEIAARAGNGPWQDVREGTRLSLVRGAEVPAGDVVPIQVRVSLYDVAPNVTMELGSDLDFAVTLRRDPATFPGAEGGNDGGTDGGTDGTGGGAGAGTDGSAGDGPTSTDTADGPRPGDGGTSTALLPATGSPLTLGLVAAVLLLLGSGSYLMTLRRHPDDRPHPDDHLRTTP